MKLFLQLTVSFKSKIVLLCLAFITTSFSSVFATNFYVSKTGDNNNAGTSLPTAFATIQKAHNVSLPGDTILVEDGTYFEEVVVTRSGNSSANITYKSINKWGAKVTNSFYNCFTIMANYIIVDGFDLKAPALYGSGVGIKPNTSVTPIFFVHHVTAINNNAHDCGQSGLSSQDADYITFENNVCYKNAWLMPFGGSGISMYGRYVFDNNPGFHYIFRGNTCYNNDNGPNTAQTDGNGIIVDDLRNTQQSSHNGLPQSLTYTTHAVLVENNLCYNNGGKGIQIVWVNNVTVRNNTVFGNVTRAGKPGDQQGTWLGELNLAAVANARSVNNVCVSNRINGSGINAAAYVVPSGIGVSSNLTFYNNITYNAANTSSSGFTNDGVFASIAGNGNRSATNPLFVAQGTDFRLKSNSPAIDAGTANYGLSTLDLDGKARVQGTNADIGAYEFVPLIPLPLHLLAFKAKRTGTTTAVLNWKTVQEINVHSFDLEKGTDGQFFTKITSISPNGLSLNHYQFIDNNITPERSFYRLKMIDRDGSFRYSAIEVLSAGKYGNSVAEFYPNPVFSPSATITVFAKETSVWRVVSSSITGQSITLQNNILTKGVNNVNVNIAALSAGIYFLRFETGDEIFTRKLLRK